MNLRTDKPDKKEYVLFVLDESGSMSSIKKQTLDGVNEQIQELRKTADQIETKVSLVTFSGTSKFVRWCEPLETFQDIKDDEYNPNGSTAMLDAVGQSVGRLKNEIADDDKNTTFLVLVVSDGEENASKEFNSTQVAKLMSELKAKKNWTITYMGANQDLSVVSEALNLSAGNSTVWHNTAVGTKSAYTTMSASISGYRGLVAASATSDMSAVNFYDTSAPPVDQVPDPTQNSSN